MLIVILVIVGLSLLILGHEAGHFFAAKVFGLKVDEFGFGFPPRITAWKKGDTEYSVNWLPFGGFVRIGGERGEFEMVSPERRSTRNARGRLAPFLYPARVEKERDHARGGVHEFPPRMAFRIRRCS